MSDSDDSDALKPRFELAEGKGTPLGELPCFTTVGARGAAAKALETALEPLHRLVYGRLGVAGTRRTALEAFRGFPATFEAEARAKLKALNKAKLRDLVMALGMDVRVSQPVEAVADGAADFLVAPKDNGKIKDSKAGAKTSKTGAKTARTSSASSSPSASQPPAKKAKTEAAPAETATKAKPPGAKMTGKKAAALPTDAEIQVHVYQRVLRMTPEQRQELGVKALRKELEQHFSVPEGDLKDRKDLIADTASDCVRALLEAERRAVLVVDTSSVAPSSWSAPSVGSPHSPPEPTPSPVPTPHAVHAPAPVDSSLPSAYPPAPPAPQGSAAPYTHQPL